MWGRKKKASGIESVIYYNNELNMLLTWREKYQNLIKLTSAWLLGWGWGLGGDRRKVMETWVGEVL